VLRRAALYHLPLIRKTAGDWNCKIFILWHLDCAGDRGRFCSLPRIPTPTLRRKSFDGGRWPDANGAAREQKLTDLAAVVLLPHL